MSMPKSAPLPEAEVRRLKKLALRMNDESLTPQQRKQARQQRAERILSLFRAGWRMPAIAEPLGVKLSTVREQIASLPISTKSVEVISPSGEKVVPPPHPKETSKNTLTEEETKVIMFLYPYASKRNFTHTEDDFERQASDMLDSVLAFLYDKGRNPADMARVVGTSNSLVRQRIRRAKGGLAPSKAQKWVYETPEYVKDRVEEYIEQLGGRVEGGGAAMSRREKQALKAQQEQKQSS